MFENWIVNDGDENRENLEQSRYYDLITRDGKFIPEAVWYKKWFSFDDGSDNAAFVTYNDEAFSLSEVLAYCPVHKAGIAKAVMKTLGLMADE